MFFILFIFLWKQKKKFRLKFMKIDAGHHLHSSSAAAITSRLIKKISAERERDGGRYEEKWTLEEF